MQQKVVGVIKIKNKTSVRGTPKGRVVDPLAREQIRTLLGDSPRRRDLLIEYLHLIQDNYGCIAAAHIVALAAEMKLAMAEVYEVATFYHHFDVVKEGDPAPAALTVRVCETLSCRMAGAQGLLDALPALLGKEIRVVPVPCIGRCEQAPAVVVDQCVVPRATAQQVAIVAAGFFSSALLADRDPHTADPEYARDGSMAAREPAPRVLKASPLAGSAEPWPMQAHRQGNAVSHVDLAAYQKDNGYVTLREYANGVRSVEGAIAAMEHAGLRGLGGAGFPAGRKWRIVRAEPGPRLMAVNIDEGEPGTFKDRYYLERDPHRFLEGMLIAASVVAIEEIYIYLRDEYAHCRELLTRELAELRANPPCALPPIHLRRGAGAYICGEESAMIESIEGKRGMPRLRPPYVAQKGLFNRPTLEHNMETLYWVRDILEKGSDWFVGSGRHGRTGLRSFSVSGRVVKPGVHLAPAGITVRELITEYCDGMLPGHQFYAYLPGGASGGILPASLGDIPLDFDTLNEYGCFIGSAAVIILSQHDKARDAALNMMRFFADESCGQCTPCRVGTVKATALLAAPRWDRELLEELSEMMADASICGLGQAAPNPIRCVIKYFPHEIG